MLSSGCNPGGYCSPASLADVDTSFNSAANALPSGPPTLLDRLLTGLVSQGHVVQAIALYLALSLEDVLAHVIRIGLPTPSSQPMRKPCGKRPWTVEDVRLLMDRWTSNWATASIGELLGRSPGAVRSKARRLGLYRRERRLLFRVAVDRADGGANQTNSRPAPETASAPAPIAAGDRTPVLDTTIEPVPAQRAMKPKRIHWNDEIDMKIAKRWFAHQHHKGIARDLGLTEGQVRTRATRMGLPARRDRRVIVEDYVEGRPYDSSLEQSVVKRRCREGNMTFYGPRNGPHTSPKVRQTKRYQELRRSIPDAMLHL